MATGRAERVSGVAHERDRRRVLVVGAVRKVDAGDAESRIHEATQRFGGGTRRPEGADDFRAAECQDSGRCGERSLPRGDEIASKRLRLLGESRDESVERLLEAGEPIDEQLIGDVVHRDAELREIGDHPFSRGTS